MRFVAFVMLITWAGLCSFAVAEERAPVTPSFLMDLEPEEKVVPTPFFLHPDLFGLWKAALAHPESEMRRQTAEAIISAHKLGHEGLLTFEPDLLNVLKQEKPLSAARYSVAHALIVLDCRNSAAALLEASQNDGKDMRQLVEPVLADWGFAPIQEIWSKRVQAADTPRRELVLALRGLAKSQVVAEQSSVTQIAADVSRPADIRLAAAIAAGELSDSGQEDVALKLISHENAATIDRLCAAALLTKHRSTQAIELNTKLAGDAEPAVAAMALRTLFATDPQTVLPIAEACLKNPDASVRRVAIEAYLAHPTPERIETLAALLNDPHPELRAIIREGFITFRENPEFADQILDLSTKALNSDNWRSQEQGALLAATFDRKEAASRLVELLPSDRHEVAIASAWALRILAVPESAQGLTEQLDRQSKLVTFSEVEIETQICHLCEALAVLKHKPATPIMEQYIPKRQQYSPLARSAAIWSLGQIYEDLAATSEAPATENPLAKAAELIGIKEKSDVQVAEKLAGEFMERVEDTDSLNPESVEVRRTSALAIGRMKAASQLENLMTKIGEEVNNEAVEVAMRWAVLRISGQELPITPPLHFERYGWFLEPINRIEPRKAEPGQ
ncbi:MAG: HEAT repeat domain-containing protein [Planctomycetaceae bacterium]